MGREVRRVSLDFKWPIGKTWEGFLNPHGGPCPAAARGECFNGCTSGRHPEGAGSSPVTRTKIQPCLAERLGAGLQTQRARFDSVSVIAQLLAVAGGDAARGPGGRGIWPHPYIQDLPMSPRVNHIGPAIGPSADLAKLTEGLAGRGPSFMGHDACDRWSIEKKIIEAGGLDPKTWGICMICKGHADDPEQRAASEAWEETPPPTGDAWQMWETTSEGSPISPPMSTPELLARWLADNKASAFGDEGASYESWLRMIVGTGWAPSAVLIGGHMMSGVEAVAAPKGSKADAAKNWIRHGCRHRPECLTAGEHIKRSALMKSDGSTKGTK